MMIYFTLFKRIPLTPADKGMRGICVFVVVFEAELVKKQRPPVIFSEISRPIG